MRIAILWKQMSGFARASFGALCDQGAELLLVHRSATADAPFDDERLGLGVESTRWSDAPPAASALRQQLERFAPDALLVCSWDVGAYRRVASAMRGRTLRILSMDNPWLGSVKQWGGRVVAPMVIRPAYDAAFLPGERQAAFAHRLGFGDDRILWGVNTCDHRAFAAVASQRACNPPPRAFLFAGRLVVEKGVDVLADAYRRYRSRTSDPWPLLVCGTGPLEAHLAHAPGVELLGFVQPEWLPAVFGRAGCLVLPSRFEPWGMVIHEATSAGMAVVCSTACGASTRLVVDGYNGEVVPPGNAVRLGDAMVRVSSAADGDRVLMGRRSAELAAQFTPDRWARYLLDHIGQLRQELGL